MLRILHVEDDEHDLALTRAILEQDKSVTVEQVHTLAAAQERLADGRAPEIDVILVDLRLPDTHDTETVAALRGHNIPLVVMSGALPADTLERAAEAGADGYIIKRPMGSEEMVGRIRFACKRHVKQAEAMASAVNLATSSRSPFKRGFAGDAFEALKPFISCGRV